MPAANARKRESGGGNSGAVSAEIPGRNGVGTDLMHTGGGDAAPTGIRLVGAIDANAPVDGTQGCDPSSWHRFKSEYDDMPIEDVWQSYKSNPTRAVRNYLIEHYRLIVRLNAERVYSRLPDEVDLDDLMSVGFFGLLDAIEAFKPDLGFKFETYCAPRIRGAILDHLRAMDWVPRLVRQRTARVEKARDDLEKSSGIRPTDDEITAHVGAEGDDKKKLLKDGSAVSVTSLSRERYQSDGSREVREIDVLEDRSQSSPLSEIQRRDLKNLLTKGLSRAERLIVVLYYFEELTMKEIGQTLDLSESRVSQMHSSILLRLKAQMQHREQELEPGAPRS